jgi:hypothetical protein
MKIIAPGGGPVVSATIAFTGTMAIGSAARAYFIRGVSLDAAKRIFRRDKSDAEKATEQDDGSDGKTGGEEDS